MTFSQTEFDIRCEWAEQGISRLASISDVVVIVDVLSFSTCVDVATARGAEVIPYPWKDDSAHEYARSIKAMVADERGGSGYSLSPESLMNIPDGSRLVLPSPNGAALTLLARKVPTLAGCLRNAQKVAAAAQRYGKRVAVIPAGERWGDDDSLRFAFEDWVGAGAIISHMAGTFSPEAKAAAAAFLETRSRIAELLLACGSGKELSARGFERDVQLASEIDVSNVAPVLRGGAYVRG